VKHLGPAQGKKAIGKEEAWRSYCSGGSIPFIYLSFILFPVETRNVWPSPDGSKLAIGGYGGNTSIWDVTSGMKVQTLESDRPGSYHTEKAITFNLDGSKIAMGDKDGYTSIWDLVNT
jgi:WD40 repeat protein